MKPETCLPEKASPEPSFVKAAILAALHSLAGGAHTDRPCLLTPLLPPSAILQHSFLLLLTLKLFSVNLFLFPVGAFCN